MIKIENQTEKIKKSELIERLIGFNARFDLGVNLLFPAMIMIGIGVIMLFYPIYLIGIFMIGGSITSIASLIIHGYRSTVAFIDGRKTYPHSELENVLQYLNEEADYTKKQLKIINKAIELINLNLQ